MSDDLKPEERPDFKNAAYNQMSFGWTLMADVIAGTERLRGAGKSYLPQEPAEQADAYQRRLSRSVFFNATRKTVDALVGMVFRKNPELSDDIPAKIKADLENIDRAGTHIDVFAKELFRDAVADGHAFILVDMPRKLTTSTTSASSIPTVADEIAAGHRPYWQRYKAHQALNWRTARVGGEVEIVQITFEEKTYEVMGSYGETEVTRYRVFTKPLIDSGLDGKGVSVRPAVYGLVSWALFKKTVDPVTKKEVFVIEQFGKSSLNDIPVAVVYGRKLGCCVSEPPLRDLAYLNVAHWQQYSDLRNIIHVTEVPILVRKGATQEQIAIEIGANSAVDVPTEGDLKWLEVSEHGASAVGRQLLMDDEQRMSSLGLSVLSEKDVGVTATEKRMDQDERTSELSTMARSEQDAIEEALGFHAEYMGLGDDKGGSIKIGVADDLILDAQTIAQLSAMVSAQQLSLETFWDMMQQGFPSVDFSDEAAKVHILGGVDTVRNAVKKAPPGIQGLYQQKKVPMNGAKANA